MRTTSPVILRDLGAGIVCLMPSPLYAALHSIDVRASDISVLTLPVDGVWSGGYGAREDKTLEKDWGFQTWEAGDVADRAWLGEIWSGGVNQQAVFESMLAPASGAADTYPVLFDLNIRNDTAILWTGFVISVIPHSGFVDLAGEPGSDRFSQVVITGESTGLMKLSYSQGVLAPGEAARVHFGLGIQGGDPGRSP